MISRMHWMSTLDMFGSHRSTWRLFVAVALLLCGISVALAGPREQAARIHDRLAGVPASDAVITQMAAQLPGNPTAAANIAMQNPNFYAVTLKNFAAPWTNRDRSTVRAPERLRHARHGHGARQRAVRSDPVGRPSLYGARRFAGSVREQQRPLRGARDAHAQPGVQSERALGARRSPARTAFRRRRLRARSRRARLPKRSSSPAPTARCSASR